MDNTKSIKQILNDDLAFTTAQLNEIAVLNSEKNDWEVKVASSQADVADESTQADASEEAEERVTTLSELENRFRSLTLALAKIEAGSYGQCEICHEQIEEGRLVANPSARTCISHMNEESQLPI